MTATVSVDTTLMGTAMQSAGYDTDRRTVEEALRLLITRKSQSHIRKYRGKLHWEGDLDAMRTD